MSPGRSPRPRAGTTSHVCICVVAVVVLLSCVPPSKGKLYRVLSGDFSMYANQYTVRDLNFNNAEDAYNNTLVLTGSTGSGYVGVVAAGSTVSCSFLDHPDIEQAATFTALSSASVEFALGHRHGGCAKIWCNDGSACSGSYKVYNRIDPDSTYDIEPTVPEAEDFEASAKTTGVSGSVIAGVIIPLAAAALTALYVRVATWKPQARNGSKVQVPDDASAASCVLHLKRCVQCVWRGLGACLAWTIAQMGSWFTVFDEKLDDVLNPHLTRATGTKEELETRRRAITTKTQVEGVLLLLGEFVFAMLFISQLIRTSSALQVVGRAECNVMLSKEPELVFDVDVGHATLVWRIDQCNAYVICEREQRYGSFANNTCSMASSVGVNMSASSHRHENVSYSQASWMKDEFCGINDYRGTGSAARGSATIDAFRQGDAYLVGSAALLQQIVYTAMSCVLLRVQFKLRDQDAKRGLRVALLVVRVLLMLFILPVSSLAPAEARELGCSAIWKPALLLGSTLNDTIFFGNIFMLISVVFALFWHMASVVCGSTHSCWRKLRVPRAVAAAAAVFIMLCIIWQAVSLLRGATATTTVSAVLTGITPELFYVPFVPNDAGVLGFFVSQLSRILRLINLGAATFGNYVARHEDEIHAFLARLRTARKVAPEPYPNPEVELQPALTLALATGGGDGVDMVTPVTKLGNTEH